MVIFVFGFIDGPFPCTPLLKALHSLTVWFLTIWFNSWCKSLKYFWVCKEPSLSFHEMIPFTFIFFFLKCLMLWYCFLCPTGSLASPGIQNIYLLNPTGITPKIFDCLWFKKIKPKFSNNERSKQFIYLFFSKLIFQTKNVIN